MLAKVYSYGVHGLEVYPVTIEVDTAKGFFSTTIVGLPDSAIKESRERVRSAMKNAGFKYPGGRITINLSPADVKKEGPIFDLAIALGILAASEQIPSVDLHRFAVIGELALDGRVQPVSGCLPAGITYSESDLSGLILPAANAAHTSIACRKPLYAVRTLAEAVEILCDTQHRTPYKADAPDLPLDESPVESDDYADVKGQNHAKRGLEIAAAGGHNILLIGPPGSGKSMLAKRLPGILPEMTFAESLEATKIHSIMGLMGPKEAILNRRPFRAPHHTTSAAAIVGGGSFPRPGEVTLSHHGVLFLDELPEFSRHVLESLRQPLEDHCVTVARAAKTLRFPAQFMLVCAMNPCPCGFRTDPRRRCQCSAQQVQRYLAKISGPLLDRIDLHIEVPSLKTQELMKPARAERSRDIQERTISARRRQLDRLEDRGIFCNAQMQEKAIHQFCPLNPECERILRQAIEQFQLSARAYGKILKLARTIADLEEEDNITINHIAEAIQYRSLDRNWWG